MALTDKLSNIAAAIRRKTGKSAELTLDEMVTEIDNIQTGSSDVPFSFGGLNAVKVGEYDETFTLADTSFVIGTSASTSATSIKATVAGRYTSPSIAIGDKDIVVVQTIKVKPTHSSSATNKAQQLAGAYCYVTHISKRKTTDTSDKTTRQASSMSNIIIKYYNTSGVLTRANASYGFYSTPQAATFGSSSAASTTIKVGSPILYYRVSSSYESSANIKLVTACTWEWHVDAYLVDAFSSAAAAINNSVDEMLTGG